MPQREVPRGVVTRRSRLFTSKGPALLLAATDAGASNLLHQATMPQRQFTKQRSHDACMPKCLYVTIEAWSRSMECRHGVGYHSYEWYKCLSM